MNNNTSAKKQLRPLTLTSCRISDRKHVNREADCPKKDGCSQPPSPAARAKFYESFEPTGLTACRRTNSDRLENIAQLIANRSELDDEVNKRLRELALWELPPATALLLIPLHVRVEILGRLVFSSKRVFDIGGTEKAEVWRQLRNVLLTADWLSKFAIPAASHERSDELASNIDFICDVSDYCAYA